MGHHFTQSRDDRWCRPGFAETIEAPRLYTHERLPQGPEWRARDYVKFCIGDTLDRGGGRLVELATAIGEGLMRLCSVCVLGPAAIFGALGTWFDHTHRGRATVFVGTAATVAVTP